MAALAAAGCSAHSRDAMVVEAEDTFPTPTSVIPVADPKLSPLLPEGWHAIEQERWRWTERRFTAVLKAPAAGEPATLKLEFVVPEVAVQRLGGVRLAAKAGGVALPAQSYNEADEQVYERLVPVEAFRDQVVLVEFELEEALPPDRNDLRELGVTVSSVGLYK